MSTSFLLPPSFWFRVALQAPYVERIVSASGVVDLPATCALPPLGKFEGDADPSWSSVSVGWNETGIGFVVEVTGKPKSFNISRQPLHDFADFCIDTRDTRDIHRASRFCHRFNAKLSRGAQRSDLEVALEQDLIPRALADAPKSDLTQVIRHASLEKQGWRLGIFLPAACLNGYDPETNRRLGLMVRVSDPSRGLEFLGVSDASFPMIDDPSLWATLELTGKD